MADIEQVNCFAKRNNGEFSLRKSKTSMVYFCHKILTMQTKSYLTTVQVPSKVYAEKRKEQVGTIISAKKEQLIITEIKTL